MNERDKIIREKSKTKDYMNKTTIVLKEKNNFEEIKSLKKELDVKNKELEKSNKLIESHKLKQEQCEEKISLFVDEKKELSDKIHQYELMELELKLQNSNDFKGKLQKADHRIDITKKLLDDSREEVAILKNIINDYDNMGFFDFIRNKKPDSMILYDDRFKDRN